MTPVAQMETAAEQSNLSLLALDDPCVEVEFVSRGIALAHRLRRATVDELHQREQRTEFSTEDVSDTEMETVFDDARGNCALWDAICVAVKGYDLGDGSPAAEWRGSDDLIRAQMPSAHKRSVVRAYLNTGKAEVIRETEAAFRLLGSSESRILLTVGDHQVTHTLRQPSEEEWQRYQKRALRSLEVKGAKKAKILHKTNCAAAVELYDALLVRIDGVTVGGREWGDDGSRGRFLPLVDPRHKQLVIAALAADYSVELQD